MRPEQESNPFVCYHTSLSEDLIANAEGLAVALSYIPQTASSWKWAVLAADMLATTALVIYVNDSSGTAALDRRSRKEWLKLLDGEFFDSVPEKRVPNLRAPLDTARSAVSGGGR